MTQAKDGFNIEAFRDWCAKLRREGKGQHVETLLSHALKASPDEPGLHKEAGKYYEGRIKPNTVENVRLEFCAKALLHYQKAYDMTSGDFYSALDLGRMMQKMGNADGGKYLRQALALNPRSGAAWLQFGLCHDLNGNGQLALMCYQNARYLNVRDAVIMERIQVLGGGETEPYVSLDDTPFRKPWISAVPVLEAAQ